MAFARPSSATVLGFSCIKLHTTDLEQVVQEDHNSRAQKRKGQAHQNHTAHKPTRTHKDWQTLEQELQDRRFKKSSKPVQVQDNFNQVQINFNFKFKTTPTKFQEHATNKHVMILSCKGVSYGIAISQTLLQLHNWIIVVP